MGRNAHRNKIRREQTRSKLLEAAVDVFVDKGFQGTRVEDIVGVAHVAKGLFYDHFASKEDLVRNFALDLGEDIQRELEKNLSRELLTDVGSVFRSAYAAVFEAVDRQRDTALVFAREGLKLGLGLGIVVQALLERVEQLAYAQFERGLREGIVRATLHYGLLARAVIGLIEQAVYYYLFHPELTRHEAIETLVEFSVAGVGKPVHAMA